MDRGVLDPEKCLRVVTSATYYPVDSGGDDQVMTLKNSVDYVRANFNEEMSVFRTPESVIVIKIWNGVTFSIVAGDEFSEELLGLLLYTVKDIAVFLFGMNFESIIRGITVVPVLQNLFSTYIRTFFGAGSSNYKAYVRIPVYHPEYLVTDEMFRRVFSFTESPAYDDFVECIVMKDHMIAGRIKDKRGGGLSMNDVFMITMLEHVQFADTEMDAGAEVVGPSASDVQHKNVHLLCDGVVRKCLLSHVRLGDNSPYVLIFAAKATEPGPTVSDQIAAIASQCARIIIDAPSPPPPPTTRYATGLVSYLAINRTTGEVREADITTRQDDSIQAQKFKLINDVRRRMVAIATESVQTGYLMTIRNEMAFQYTFELKFVNSRGQTMTPTKSLGRGMFEDSNYSYTAIANYLFPNDNDITIYEFMTAYIGICATREVIDANRRLFDSLRS